MSELAKKPCIPCKSGVPPLKGGELVILTNQLSDDWRCIDEHHLTKDYAFPDFVTALAFTNKVGTLAEDVNHHPDIGLAWGKVSIQIWTHKIDGLTESDFIFAAKCDAL